MKPDEHDEVKKDGDLLVEALRQAAVREAGTRHLTPPELLGYLHGEAGGAEDRVQGHLAACRECTDALLDLQVLDTPGFGPAGVDDFEKAAAWQSVRNKVLEQQRDTFRSRARFAYAAAAALFACVLGLSFWMMRMPGGASEEPQIDVPLIYLDAATTRGGAEVQVVLPRSTSPIVLILTPSQSVFPEYRVEIGRGQADLLWSGAGLHLSEYGALRLALPPSLLAPGSYSVRVYGTREKASQALDSYVLHVSKPKE